MNDSKYKLKLGSTRSFPAAGRLAMLAAGLLVIGACASVPEAPDQEIQAAELAIANAERGKVADFAPSELRDAREKLSASRAAAQNGQMIEARRLAELSRLDADLATARADIAKAQAVNDEIQKGIDALKQEMQRNTGARS